MTVSVVPILKTERLVLRGPLATDTAPLAAFLSGPRAVWTGGPYPAEDAPYWLEHLVTVWQRRGWGSWIVALASDDTPIGRVGMLDHEAWDEPELAWFLFDGFEGRGYATEAVRAARAHGNGPLGLPALCSFIDPANTRSRALAERLGARQERGISLDGLAFDLFRHPMARGQA